MLSAALAFAAASLVQGTALTAAQNAVMTPVTQFIDAFNKGDVKAATSMCADQASIIDEFPPHEWHGSGSCARWMQDFDADAKKNGITDPVVTLAGPSHVDVSGDRAYIVVPADYVYKLKGKVTKETGSTLTLALQKGAAGWKLTGWSWSKH